MIETEDITTTTECSVGTTKKKHPKLRSEIEDQGSRETTPEHIAQPKNSSMDRAHYTGSETNAESSDQGTPSETADASSSSQKKKVDLRQQQHSPSQA